MTGLFSIAHCLRPLLTVALMLLMTSALVSAQTATFTYQGRLQDTGTPANGNYDLQFALFDNSSGGTQVGTTQTASTVSVSGGVFTVQLDFGVSAFPGANRFLEIRVRPSGGGTFTTLSPRQPINSTPYAVRSANATTADALSSACVACVQDSQISSVAGSKVSGTVATATTATNASNATNATNATTATNATQLGGVAASQYVVTSDARLTDSRAPTAGSTNYIQNTTPGSGTNFNISGNGTAGGTLSSNIINATTQYNLGNGRVLSVTGSSNLFAGQLAGQANTSGQNNAFFGSGAGFLNTAGRNNSFFGTGAGVNNTTATDNAFFGTNAGSSNTASNNSFFGSAAGFNNTTGTFNAFFGTNAGSSNTMGANNAFFGNGAGILNMTGSNNAFFGGAAGQANTAGSNNAFFGTNAGLSNTEGSSNDFFGFFAGSSNTMGTGNAFFGLQAGFRNSTGNRNAFFGDKAGLSNTTGSDNTIIGSNADVGSNNLVNATAIGANASVTRSNSLVLGNGTDTFVGYTNSIPAPDTAAGDNLYIANTNGDGINSFRLDGFQNNLYIVARSGAGSAAGAGIVFRTSTTTTPGGEADRMSIAPNGNVTVTGSVCAANVPCPSDARLKQRVTSLSYGLREVLRLRPVRWQWKDTSTAQLNMGLIAQEVEPVLPELILHGVDAKGSLGLNYMGLIPVLVKGIQEQQTQIDEQRKQINQQEHRVKGQQKQIETLLTSNAALDARLRGVEKSLRKRVGSTKRRH